MTKDPKDRTSASEGAIREYHWCVQDAAGNPCARGTAAKQADAEREAMHYLVQYAQDGPAEASVRLGRKTLMSASMSMANFTARLGAARAATTQAGQTAEGEKGC